MGAKRWRCGKFANKSLTASSKRSRRFYKWITNKNDLRRFHDGDLVLGSRPVVWRRSHVLAVAACTVVLQWLKCSRRSGVVSGSPASDCPAVWLGSSRRLAGVAVWSARCLAGDVLASACGWCSDASRSIRWDGCKSILHCLLRWWTARRSMLPSGLWMCWHHSLTLHLERDT